MKIGIIIVVVVGVVVAIIMGSLNNEVVNEPVVETRETREMRDREEGVIDEMKDEMNDTVESMNTEDVVDETETVTTASQQGVYANYTPELVAQADGDIVLFFHASWCPSCRTQDAAITNGAAEIPADLTILKVDYDSSTELKRKYNVVTQHTFVQVDGEGNEITKWLGGSTLAALVANVQ